MSLESDLMAVLLELCPRVVVGTAPENTVTPYVTWQHAGGDSLRYVDGSAADKRKPEIQVNAWAATPVQAFALIQQIEEALCMASAFQAKPQSEPVGAYDDADIASGYLQTFSILGAR